MNVGDVWLFDNLKTHSTVNGGETDRITLIVSHDGANRNETRAEPAGDDGHQADARPVRENAMVRDAGTLIAQHSHTYDHITLLACGSMRVQAGGEMLGDFTGPVGILIKAGVKHRMTTLTDGVVFCCIHALHRLPMAWSSMSCTRWNWRTERQVCSRRDQARAAPASAQAPRSTAPARAAGAKSAANLQQAQYNTTRGDLTPHVPSRPGRVARGERPGWQWFYSPGRSGLCVGQAYANLPGTMTQAQLEATPGYQFTLSIRGSKRCSRLLAARGLGMSGVSLKGAADYATGLADKNYSGSVQYRTAAVRGLWRTEHRAAGQSHQPVQPLQCACQHWRGCRGEARHSGHRPGEPGG